MLHDAKNTVSESTLGSIALDADDVIERSEIIAAFPSSQLWSCNHEADTQLHAPRYGTARVLEHGTSAAGNTVLRQTGVFLLRDPLHQHGGHSIRSYLEGVPEAVATLLKTNSLNQERY
jgi:hypothetical protein